MDRKEMEDIIRQSKATLAVEGLHVTKKEEDLLTLVLNGKLSAEEYLNIISEDVLKDTEEEKDLERSLQEAKASLAIEGLYLTPLDEELLKAKGRGLISQDEFIELSLRLARDGK